MTVRIVTDSLSDLSGEHNVDELGITIVPLTVLFGHETFLDRVTITTDEFYRRLVEGKIWPASTQPSPQDFADTYDKAAEHTDEILTVTLSSKLSGTYQSAKAGIELRKNKKCRVAVIDSMTVAMGLGLVVLSAAKAAKDGMDLDKLVDYTKKALTRSHFIAYFDTLKYLAKGGRIGKAAGLVGSMLSVKPLLSVKGGEMSPVTRLRSRAAGMEYLYNFMTGFKKIEMVGIEHTTDAEIADALAKLFSAAYPKVPVIRSTVSPVLGVHGGPNAMAVTVLEAEEK
jgi:DegV family protein with EDD domain